MTLIILYHHIRDYGMHSDEIAIGQVITLRSYLSGVHGLFDFSSQMTLRYPVLGDTARGIDEPPAESS